MAARSSRKPACSIPTSGETRSLRSKEDAHDYRYFPDPDLLPLELSDAFLAECRASLPELPDAKRARYESELGLTAYNAARAHRRRHHRPLVRGAARRDRQVGAEIGKRASNWVISELFGALNRLGKDIERQPGQPRPRAPNCSRLVADGTLSGTLAKQVFEIMLETGEDAGRDRRGARPQADQRHRRDRGGDRRGASPPMPDKVAEYRGGKDKLFGFFVGQTMKAMAGQGQSGGGQRAAEEGARLSPRTAGLSACELS